MQSHTNKVHKYQELLHSLRLRQVELATKLNISRQRVSDIFQGRSDFSEEQKIFLCKEYKINLNWLLADVGSMFIGEDIKITDERQKLIDEVSNDVVNKLTKGGVILQFPTQ